MNIASQWLTSKRQSGHPPWRHSGHTKTRVKMSLKRHAFTMKLKPGPEVAAEYKKRHDELWPDLAEVLTNAGISDYTIFLHEPSGVLFAVQKQASVNTIADLPDNPVVKRWWAFMADLMDVNPDNSPVCKDLKEVFHFS